MTDIDRQDRDRGSAAVPDTTLDHDGGAPAADGPHGAQAAAPTAGGRWRGRLAAFSVVLAVLVVPIAIAVGLTLTSGPGGPATARVVSASELEQEYGIKVNLVAVIAAGGLVDVRFTVLDKDKAGPPPARQRVLAGPLHRDQRRRPPYLPPEGAQDDRPRRRLLLPPLSRTRAASSRQARRCPSSSTRCGSRRSAPRADKGLQRHAAVRFARDDLRAPRRDRPGRGGGLTSGAPGVRAVHGDSRAVGRRRIRARPRDRHRDPQGPRGPAVRRRAEPGGPPHRGRPGPPVGGVDRAGAARRQPATPRGPRPGRPPPRLLVLQRDLGDRHPGRHQRDRRPAGRGEREAGRGGHRAHGDRAPGGRRPPATRRPPLPRRTSRPSTPRRSGRSGTPVRASPSRTWTRAWT